MYFNDADYEVFTQENEFNKNRDIIQKRITLQNKILQLHKSIYPKIQKLGLSTHENQKHITSIITPDKFRGQIHNWILVRYGKTPQEVEPYKAVDYGFTKHACLQFGLFEGADFEISLFLGRKDGFDRLNLKKMVDQNSNKIKECISMMKGYGIVWYVGDNYFEFDTDNPDTFCNWLVDNNSCEFESYMSIVYDRNDERISSFEKISNEIVSKMTMLNTLYNLLVKRSKLSI